MLQCGIRALAYSVDRVSAEIRVALAVLETGCAEIPARNGQPLCRRRVVS